MSALKIYMWLSSCTWGSDTHDITPPADIRPEINYPPEENLKTGTNRNPVANRPTRWGIFWKMALTCTPDPIELGGVISGGGYIPGDISRGYFGALCCGGQTKRVNKCISKTQYLLYGGEQISDLGDPPGDNAPWLTF